MARLHEYQGKAILAANGFKIPRGSAASTADEAVAAAKEVIDGKKSGEVVIKIQAWTTGRAGIGGVAFAKKPDDVRAHAARMLAMKVGQFPVEAVLVEEKIAIEREFFLSFAIDDAARAPIIIFAGGGGSGIEERAASTRRIPCDVNRGPLDSAVSEAVASCGLSPAHAAQLAESIQRLFAAARSVEVILNSLQCREHLRQLGRLIDLPVFLRREPDAGAIRATALVRATEGGCRGPGSGNQL